MVINGRLRKITTGDCRMNGMKALLGVIIVEDPLMKAA